MGARVVYASGMSLERFDGVNGLEPTSPYLRAKRFGELSFLSMGSACILRVSSPAGPGLPPDAVLSKFIESVRQNRPIEIWGSGLREQNYLDTRDIAEYFIRALNSSSFGIKNLCNVEPITMENLANRVIRVLGEGAIQKCEMADPKEDQRSSWPMEKTFRELGEIQFRPLEDSIRRIAFSHDYS